MEHELELLLKRLLEADRRAAVWCACVCARTALHLAPGHTPWPRLAIDTAEAWVFGDATEAECRSAAARAADVDHAATSAASTALPEAPPDAGYTAAYAAAASVAYATVGLDADEARWGAALDAHLDRLLATISAQRWPVTIPSFGQLQAAPTTLQVAWDCACSRGLVYTTLSIVELIEARARAHRLHLSWLDPVARAITEQLTGEVQIQRVISTWRAR
ncbi:MAG TPA: hypothetical protein ENK18_18955 [Deltaproteobacteria bacterium]|nr:hypothetical protein [Deltaproteobacteria bacterium]